MHHLSSHGRHFMVTNWQFYTGFTLHLCSPHILHRSIHPPLSTSPLSTPRASNSTQNQALTMTQTSFPDHSPRPSQSSPTPDISAAEQVSLTILSRQIWLIVMLFFPAYKLCYDGDEFARHLGLLLFVFGAVPILFSAAIGSGSVEAPGPVRVFGKGGQEGYLHGRERGRRWM